MPRPLRPSASVPPIFRARGPVTRTAANRVPDYTVGGIRYDGNSGRPVNLVGAAITPSNTPIVQPPQRARNQALSNAAQNAGLPAWNWKAEENAAALAAAEERGKFAAIAREAQLGGKGYITGENLPAVLDQSRADYWQAADMQAWAKANHKLAKRAMERAGYAPQAAQAAVQGIGPVIDGQDYGRQLDALQGTSGMGPVADVTTYEAMLTPAEEQRRRASELASAYLRGIQQQWVTPGPGAFDAEIPISSNPSLGFSYAPGRKFLRGADQ